MTENTLLAEQIAYYRARAAEYDEWFYRVGRYDQGAKLNQHWFDEAAQVRTALHQLPPVDTALELACGTGIWTRELLQIAQSITALDASSEMLTLNQAKINLSPDQSPRVTYVQANLFEWEPQPAEAFDLVFFSFWLSHVPPDRLSHFLMSVNRALKPAGKLFIIDSRRAVTSTAHDHVLPEEGDIYQQRKLNDGSSFRIVKIFYAATELRQLLEAAGFEVTITETPTYFIYASGQKHKPG